MHPAKDDVVVHLDEYVVVHRQQIIAGLENWLDKYALPLHQIEAERAAAAAKLADFLQELGYE
jgi:type I restriction enzyme M protein